MNYADRKLAALKAEITPEKLERMTPEQRVLFTHMLLRLESFNEIYSIAKESYTGRFLIMLGGSGSGKSYAAAEKIIDRITREDGHRFLCVRARRNQVTESQFPLLHSTIKRFCNLYPKQIKYFDFKINTADGKESIRYKKTSSEIIFAGLDDVEKLKSIHDITGVWIEEADQITAEDLRELDRRLRGHASKGKYKNGKKKYEQIILTLNPVSSLCWIKKKFFDDEFGNYKKIAMRGEKEFMDFPHYSVYLEDKELLKKELEGKNLMIVHSTYLDNRFLSPDEGEKYERLKNESPEEYMVYCLGQWGISGGTYFDRNKVNDRIAQNPHPIKRGFFEFQLDVAERIKDDTIKWVDDDEGYIQIFEEPKPGHPYVLGGDTAGEGSDYNVGYVVNNNTDDDAAVLRYKFDEDLYAMQVYCLGKYYNTALVGIETNFSTHPQKVLERLNYPNLYIREEAPDSMTGKLVQKYGWNTNKATRPLILSMLRTLVREHPECIKCLDTLYEMTTFVTNEKGKAEAQQGAHDDLIMARAIVMGIKGQQTTEIAQTAETLKGYYTEEELEDMGLSKYQIKRYLKKDYKPWKEYDDD
jgi:phage terminase large subunit